MVGRNLSPDFLQANCPEVDISLASISTAKGRSGKSRRVGKSKYNVAKVSEDILWGTKAPTHID